VGGGSSTYRVDGGDIELAEGRLAGAAADRDGRVLGHARRPLDEVIGLEVKEVVEAQPVLGELLLDKPWEEPRELHTSEALRMLMKQLTCPKTAVKMSLNCLR
jgi:hypothetical protein